MSSVHSEDRGVYLDHQASTPLDSSALDAMRTWFLEEFGNPHASEHAYGWLRRPQSSKRGCKLPRS